MACALFAEVNLEAVGEEGEEVIGKNGNPFLKIFINDFHVLKSFLGVINLF